MAYVSVIVPVYNSENTLKNAFNSILNQTIGFENLEVIFVDDASTDSSADIIRDFSNQYDNVKLISLNENSGFAGKPRNVGIENATSDFLMFLDSDDEYMENACSLLYENIKDAGLDIVSGNYVKYYNGKTSPYKWNNIELKDGVLQVDSIHDEPELFTLVPSVWAKIFRKEMILNNDITFPVGISAQDFVFVNNSLLKANGIKFIDEAVIKYSPRDEKDGSVTLSKSKSVLSGYLTSYNLTYDLFKKNNEDRYIKYSLAQLDFWSKQFSLSDLDRTEKLDLLKQAHPLFKQVDMNKFTHIKFLRQFFEKIIDEEYEEAMDIADDLAMVFDRKNPRLTEEIKSRRIVTDFFGYDVEIGGVATAVCNRTKLFVDHGYSVTLLNFDELKNYDYITNHYYEQGYLYDSVNVVNINDYYRKKFTTTDETKRVNLDGEYDKFVDGYFIRKVENLDQTVTLFYHDCKGLKDCTEDNLIKEEMYLNNTLGFERTFSNGEKALEKLYTADGYNYITMDYGAKQYMIFDRITGETLKFPGIRRMHDHFIYEISDTFQEKLILINDSPGGRPSLKNIDLDLGLQIGMVHSNPYTTPPYSYGSNIRLITSAFEHKETDAVVVLTESEKRDFEHEFKSRKFHVIPNIIFDEAAEYINRTEKDPKMISLFARIAPEKNISDLIRAFNIILKKHPDAVLKIYGRVMRPSEIAEKRKLDELVQKLDITDSIKFMGFYEDSQSEMRKSIATVLVSDYEGFPLVIPESMLNATPIISYDTNYGPSDIINHGVDGLLVNKGDIKELADMICDVLDDPFMAIRMGVMARRKMLKGYSSEIIFNKWEGLFKKVYVNRLIKKYSKKTIKQKPDTKDKKTVKPADKTEDGKSKRNFIGRILSKGDDCDNYRESYEQAKQQNAKLKTKIKKLKAKNKKLSEKNKILEDKTEDVALYYSKKIYESNRKKNAANARTIKKLKMELDRKQDELDMLVSMIPKEMGRKLLYKTRFNKDLDLTNPKDLNEKVNWLIVNKYGEREGRLTDKYLVKDIVKKMDIPDLHIPETYKTYKNVDDIDIDELPDKFVLKCNHFSGKVFICSDKSSFNLNEAKYVLDDQLNQSYASKGLEYHYDYIDPCIIAEEYLEDPDNAVPVDYKFYCFDGKADNILACTERDTGVKLDDFDLEWNLRQLSFKEYLSTKVIEKPPNLDKMVKIAERLSEGHTFVRVDLYNINNKIYFGEYTFTPGNGTIAHYKQSALDYLGSKINLPISKD